LKKVPSQSGFFYLHASKHFCMFAKTLLMILTSKLKGYLFAFIATIALSNVYIFSKAALNEIHIVQFGLYWFGFAILWNIIYSKFSRRIREVKKLRSTHIKTLIGIGLVEIVATTTFFIAIDIIPNPSISPTGASFKRLGFLNK